MHTHKALATYIVVINSHLILYQSVHAPRLFPDRGFHYDLLCKDARDLLHRIDKKGYKAIS